MSFDHASLCLKAAADPSRLRLLAVLACGEASVGELQAVLAQSQPRVSRHLRLLTEAGLVERDREGHWVFYRLVRQPAANSLLEGIWPLIDTDDPQRLADQQSFEQVKQARRRDAYSSGAALVAASQSRERPDAGSLTAALDEVLGDTQFSALLDIGCGSGALLALLARRSQKLVGVDVARSMRNLARSRASDQGLANCSIRDGELSALPFADQSFDCVVLDEVLSVVADPGAGLDEAIRVLRPFGQLLVLDCVAPVAVRLESGAGRRLIENQLSAWMSERRIRLRERIWFPGKTLAYALFAGELNPVWARTGTGN